MIKAGLFNGGFIGELSEMKLLYENSGMVFPERMTDGELLEVIETLEEERNNMDTNGFTTDERIAVALEFLVMVQLPDNTG